MTRRLTTCLGAAALACAGLASAGWSTAPTPSHNAHDRVLIVAADGTGRFTTVQAAVNAIAPGEHGGITILIKPGVYQGQVYVPADKPGVTLLGLGRDPSDVVLVDDIAHGTIAPNGNQYGTDCSATVTVAGDRFAAYGVTIQNSFDPVANPGITSPQAVAVKAVADRVIFARDRFLGLQDTVFASSYADPFQPQECFAEDGTPTPPATSTTGQADPPPARQLFVDDYVAGRVDFICGSGTAVFEHDTIDIVGGHPGGTVTAPDTPLAHTYGYLVDHSRIVNSDGTLAPGADYLGRPWRHTGVTNPVGQITIRNTFLDAIINSGQWQNWSSPPFPWTSARFAEYDNTGPGSAYAPDVPQLTPSQAAQYTPATYLGDWRP
jgi:pectinesterase